MYDRWTERSIELRKTPEYGRRLQKHVYPEQSEQEKSKREVPVEKIHALREAKHEEDEEKMLSAILDLDKRPFNDRYISSLEKYDNPWERDPHNASRIA